MEVHLEIVTYGSALLLFLAAMKALAPDWLPFLPLGGSAISEIGIVFAVCIGLTSLFSVI